MNIQYVYTIYDVVAQEPGPLFTAPNNEVAKRNFRSMLKQAAPENQEDYELICIGEYHLDTVTLSGYQVNSTIKVKGDENAK